MQLKLQIQKNTKIYIFFYFQKFKSSKFIIFLIIYWAIIKYCDKTLKNSKTKGHCYSARKDKINKKTGEASIYLKIIKDRRIKKNRNLKIQVFAEFVS